MDNNKCHDCGILEGQIHELGCDMESCPFCGNQLISCSCVYKKLELDCSKDSFTYTYGLTIPEEQQWLTILEEKGRVPYIVYPNICTRYGKLWPEIFIILDEDWNKYIQINQRCSMICKECFDIIKNLIEINITVIKVEEQTQEIVDGINKNE